ncbi:hypothetical protein FIV07_22525 [Mycobacterium sp. THAF192]|nr:hypothetical protein FIV07_22525 [Mycobacterium sp. THAF192]
MTSKRTNQPGRVTVEVETPHAVFFDGKQRTGTIEGVPLELAKYWIRRGWAAYVFGNAIAE